MVTDTSILLEGDITSGNIRGWGLWLLFIDGQYSELPYGQPWILLYVSGSINSGFGQIFNYGLLGAGEHIFTVHMNDGQISEDTATFTVVALPKAFYPDDERDFSIRLALISSPASFRYTTFT